MKERPTKKQINRAYAAVSIAFEIPVRVLKKSNQFYAAIARVALMQFFKEYLNVSNSVIGEIVPSTRWSEKRKTYAVSRHNVVAARRKHKKYMTDPQYKRGYSARYYKIAVEYKTLLERENATTKQATVQQD